MKLRHIRLRRKTRLVANFFIIKRFHSRVKACVSRAIERVKDLDEHYMHFRRRDIKDEVTDETQTNPPPTP